MRASLTQRLTLADKLGQSPAARDGLRPDLDLVVDLDADLDRDISGVATSPSTPRCWTGKTSEPSWRKNSPSPRPRQRPGPSITKGMHSHCPRRVEPRSGVSSFTLFAVATVRVSMRARRAPGASRAIEDGPFCFVPAARSC